MKIYQLRVHDWNDDDTEDQILGRGRTFATKELARAAAQGYLTEMADDINMDLNEKDRQQVPPLKWEHLGDDMESAGDLDFEVTFTIHETELEVQS